MGRSRYALMLSGILLGLGLIAHGLDLNAPPPPTFPSTFEVYYPYQFTVAPERRYRAAADVLCVVQVAYNFTLPYESLVQKDGLTYPVVFWRDAEKGLSRMDTFGGRNILITGKVMSNC